MESTGRSKGQGVVIYENVEEAQKAIKVLPKIMMNLQALTLKKFRSCMIRTSKGVK